MSTTQRAAISIGVLALLALAPAAAPGQARGRGANLGDMLIAAESFDYPKTGPLSGLNGGTGWSGPWFTSPLNKEDNEFVTPGMSFAGVAVSGGKTISPGRETRTFRTIDLTRADLQPIVDERRLGKD